LSLDIKPLGRAQDNRTVKSSLIHGDCLEALRSIKTNSLDFCFADHPYDLRKKYYKSNDNIEVKRYFEWCDSWLAELFRVLKPGRTLAILNIPLWASRHFEYLSSIMVFQNWIAWDSLSFPVRNIMPAHYGIVCFSKGEARPLPGLTFPNAHERDEYLSATSEHFCHRDACASLRIANEIEDLVEITDLWYDIFRLMHNSRRVSHPCQLPPLLMRRLFALFTKKGELTLDCFNGAGTSSLVAAEMARRYIGIEISKRFHNLAAKRQQLLANGIDPFDKNSDIPRVKNSALKRVPKQRYEVSKKALQLDVLRIAIQVGRLPTREDVIKHSAHPFDYFQNYFRSWSEVCAAARLATEASQVNAQTSSLIM
jgi:site-specific DNA-methyltransferase (adenine-specific)